MEKTNSIESVISALPMTSEIGARDREAPAQACALGRLVSMGLIVVRAFPARSTTPPHASPAYP